MKHRIKLMLNIVYDFPLVLVFFIVFPIALVLREYGNCILGGLKNYYEEIRKVWLRAEKKDKLERQQRIQDNEEST